MSYPLKVVRSRAECSGRVPEPGCGNGFLPEFKVMNVAITGASGFIGSHLSSRLSVLGHQVTPLWRYLFTQDSVDCLAETLAGCGAVINLAGAPIDRRWTDDYKKELWKAGSRPPASWWRRSTGCMNRRK